MAKRGLPPGTSPHFDDTCLRGKPSNVGSGQLPAMLDIDRILSFFGWIGGRIRRLVRR